MKSWHLHIEKLARVLAVVSFVLLCWVVHRSLEKRTHCVNSPFVAFVQIGGDRIENCIYESRLSLKNILHPLPQEKLALVRALETLDPLAPLFKPRQPRLAVDISLESPKIFNLGHGYVRIGREWVEKDPLQTQRALIMGVLRRERPKTYDTQFQLEVMTDFLLLSVFNQRNWYGHSPLQEVRLATSAPNFAEYCKSPFRSLAHESDCSREKPDSTDLEAAVWGMRPLMATALWRVYEHSSLPMKLRAMRAMSAGRSLPLSGKMRETSLEAMVTWFDATLHMYASSLRLSEDLPVKRALKELEVEAPTHWELTVDVTNTPAWREILKQFQKWSQFHLKQRTVVFTPEGAIALPSGLPMGWAGTETIHSQKHVMIACAWPADPENMIPVTARHIYAKQSCEKVDNVFWN